MSITIEQAYQFAMGTTPPYLTDDDDDDDTPVLTRANAMTSSDISTTVMMMAEERPRLLQLSIEDWDRINNPPLRPQQPLKPLPMEEEPFEVY